MRARAAFAPGKPPDPTLETAPLGLIPGANPHGPR